MLTYTQSLQVLEQIINRKCNLNFSLELEDLMELDRNLRVFYFGGPDNTSKILYLRKIGKGANARMYFHPTIEARLSEGTEYTSINTMIEQTGAVYGGRCIDE